MLHDIRMSKVFRHPGYSPPQNLTDVEAWARKQVQEADAEAKKHPIPGMKWDGAAMLNESADELAFEAMAS
jgi:hypothetical protein